MTSVEHARLDARSRCSSISIATSTRAARDVQAAINAAGGELPAEPADPAQLPQGQPGRLADPDPVAARSETLPLAQVFDAANTRARAEDLAGRRASGRCSSAAASSRRCACRSIRRRWPASACRIEDVRTALAHGDGRTSPRARSAAQRSRYAVAANDQLFGADGLPSRSSSLRRTAPRVRLGRRGRAWSTTSRTTASPAGSTASARCCMIIRRQPGANILETIDGVKALLPAARRSRSRRPSTSRSALDRAHDHPRLGARRRASRCCISVVLVVLVVFVFLRSVRATAIPSVAVPLSLVGDVRRHVPARLQPRQPVADGADHLDRLRRRRRHRRHREHHPLHRDGRAAAARPRSRARGRSASPSSRSPSRCSPCSSRSCSWAASSAACSASSRSPSASRSRSRRWCR